MGTPIISCDKLSGLAEKLCRQEIEKTLDPATQRVWTCVEDLYERGGGKKDELRKLANRGTVADPLWNPLLRNDPKKLEPQEMLSFAYSDPQYHSCLAAESFPIPFLLDDFDPSTTEDGEISASMRSETSETAAAVERDLQSPIDEAEKKCEISKRIYDHIRKKHPFHADCAIECSALESMKHNLGACSESSAVLYAHYREAGLNPSMVFMQDFNPSLDWIELMPKLGDALLHIFIDVPIGKRTLPLSFDPNASKPPNMSQEDFEIIRSLKKGLPTCREGLPDSGIVHVDMINEIFGADYKFGRPISEADFTTFWLSNRQDELAEKGKISESLATTERAIALSPGMLYLYMRAKYVYTAAGQNENAQFLEKYIDRNFTDNPMRKFISLFDRATALNKKELTQKLTPKESAERTRLGKEMDKLQEKHPSTSAWFALNLASSEDTKYRDMKRRLKSDGVVATSAVVTSQKETLTRALTFYASSLGSNPNSPFAVKKLEALIAESQDEEAAFSIYRQLAIKYPNHTPFLYFLLVHTFKLIKSPTVSEGNTLELLKFSDRIFQKIISIEPNHPQIYRLASQQFSELKKMDIALNAAEKAGALFERRDGVIPPGLVGDIVALRAITGHADGAIELTRTLISEGNSAVLEKLGRSLFDNISLDINPTVPPKLLTEPVSLEPLDANTLGMLKAILSLTELLKVNPRAKVWMDLNVAYFLPSIVIIMGRDEAQRWIDVLSTTDQEKFQERAVVFAVNKLVQLLGRSKLLLNTEMYDNALWYIEWLEKNTSDKLRPNFNILYGVTLWAGLIAKSEKIVNFAKARIPAENLPELYLESLGLVQTTGEDVKENAERVGFILNQMWQCRETLSPELRSKFSFAYDEYSSSCKKFDLTGESVLAEERSRILRTIKD